jgi:phosphoribosylformylglycinamidine cyclo-ligase
VLPVFKWLAEQGGIAELELLRTFNLRHRHDCDRRGRSRGRGRWRCFAASGETVALLGEVIPAAGEAPRGL